MNNIGRAFYSTHPESVRSVHGVRTVWLSWTYEIFIDPASPWIGRLVDCPLLIRVSGNKQTTGQTSTHTSGMWTLEILYTGRESGRGGKADGSSVFDLDSVCNAPGARGLTFKLGLGSRDLKPDKLQPSEQLNILHMALLVSLFCSQ